MTVLCVSLFVACVFDYRRRKIPNLLNAWIFLAGAARGLLLTGMGGLFRYLFFAIAVVVLLLPLYRIGGFGAGDVKLLGVCAGYFPSSKIFSFLFVSMLISAAFSIARLLKDRDGKERVQYFLAYCGCVLRSGKWHLYLPEKNGRPIRGICLAGPILCSALLCRGGVF